MPRILIVEDSEDLAEALAHNLELEGHEAKIAGDGRVALERRLAIPPAETSVNDVGAYGLEGSYTLEVVADRPIAATLTQPNKRLEIEENQ